MLDDKVKLEGLFTVVLYGKSSFDSKEKVAKRYFVTNRDGQYPSKSPFGMFDDLYPSFGNDVETTRLGTFLEDDLFRAVFDLVADLLYLLDLFVREILKEVDLF